MKMFKTKVWTSIILIVILISGNIIPCFAAENFDTMENEDLIIVDGEEKQLCNATLDDDFADDSVVVIFNNDTSLELNSFDKSDFSNINVSSVNDITEYKVDTIKNECISRADKMDSVSTEEFSSVSAMEKDDNNYYFNEYLKEEYSDFHQMVVLKLERKGKQEVLDAIHELEKREDVLVAEPNYTAHIDAVPSDKYLGEQWAVDKISLPSAWEITTGSKSVNVGVVDTGIKTRHSDLTANINTSLSKSFIDDSPLTDTWGHGTHVAGIIGAVGNNNNGITGVCWNINLVSLKIHTIDADGNIVQGGAAGLAEALFYAEENNIEIVNSSNSFDKNPACLKEAIDNYSGILITSAGNQNKNIDEPNGYKRIYPATFENDNIVVVAASKQDDRRWYTADGAPEGSNYGVKSVDLAAPGFGIYSTYNGETSDRYYINMTGTSMATPYVAGVAALIKSKYPGISVFGIKKALLDSVDKVSSWTNLVKTGGRLNAYKALTAVENCKYTVIYDKNGGTGSNMSNTTVTYGINTKLRKNTYSPISGKKFIGWYAHRQSDDKWYYVGSSGSGWYKEGSQPSGYSKALYKDETAVAHTTSKNGDIVTMYAQWKPSSYIVTYKPNGGGGASHIAPQEVTYGTSVILNKNTYGRGGFLFKGWAAFRKSDNKWSFTNGNESRWYVEGEQPNGYTKKIYANQATVINLSGVDNDSVYMYAQWEPNAYTIYFNSNGGTGNMNPIIGHSFEDVNLGKNKFTKPGYLFSGWNIVDDDGFWCVIRGNVEDWYYNIPAGCSKKLFNNNDTVNYQSDDGCNLTAYAQWVSKDSVLIGDVNLDGDIDINDVTTIQKYLSSIVTFNDVQLFAADVNKDGKVDIDDATALQYLLI